MLSACGPYFFARVTDAANVSFVALTTARCLSSSIPATPGGTPEIRLRGQMLQTCIAEKKAECG